VLFPAFPPSIFDRFEF